MKKVLFIFGTRPEVIKLAPLIKEVQKYPRQFKVKLCVTAQHREMLDKLLKFFNLKPDYDLNLMKPNQTLFDITSRSLIALEPVLDDFKPRIIFVQGDTTSSLMGMVAAMYKKITIVHIEAGLRSGNKYAPFPEEMNRVLISHLADYHFTPTRLAAKNLAREGITKKVFVVGNTVTDALFMGLNLLDRDKKIQKTNSQQFKFLDFSKKIILVTGHRRESFGRPLQNICRALKTLAVKNPGAQIVYPVHPNPNVIGPVKKILGGRANIHLLPPLDYPALIWLMKKSYFIITDSGGIQEEAPSLGKPLLVTRTVTERPEGIKAGVAELVGNSQSLILSAANRLLNNSKHYRSMARPANPYGDGKASQRIVKILKKI